MPAVITPGGRVGDNSPLGKTQKGNWVSKRGGLPDYVRIVANALVRSGHDTSKAIAMAIASMKRWARGGGNVSPKVSAAASKALAQWEAMKATTAAAVYPDYYADIDVEDLLTDEALVAALEAFNAALDETDSLNDFDSTGDTMTLLDGIYEEVVDDAGDFATSLLAGAAPLHPPGEWFDDPRLDRLTPITLTADGKLYGHIADWNMNHIGIPGARKPPRSLHNYAFFKTGVLQTAEGTDVPVGQITLAGGHAGLNATAGQAVKHYDDTATAFADVTCGEDQFGIWVSGAVRPGVSETDVRAIRASAPSGDWRPINGALELVAVCQVNVPGFPVPRGMVAGGELISLIAAGAPSLYALRQEDEMASLIASLEDRITRMEDRSEHAIAMVAEAGAVDPAVEDPDDDGDDDLENGGDADGDSGDGVFESNFEIEADPDIDSGDDEDEDDGPVIASAKLSRLEELRARNLETRKMELNRRMARVKNC